MAAIDLEKIKRVSIELSNLCNYATLHKKCPLHLVVKPIILSQQIVYHVLDFLSYHDFTGKIAFHTYNEPGIDPRLFLFIKYARDKCPKSYIFLMSNGYYLDQNLLDDYKSTGLDEIIISAYTESEYARISALNPSVKLTINKCQLDERLNLYQRNEINIKKPCHAPLNELIITREGNVGLCCLDWKREVIFGDLHKETIEIILNKENLLNTYEELSHGLRKHNICRRCDWSR